MNLLTVEEKIQCPQNLLADLDDWISLELLRLANDNDNEVSECSDGPLGINEWSPEANKYSRKPV